MREEGRYHVPIAATDYCYVTESSTLVLCLTYCQTGAIAAHTLQRKETTTELVRLVVKDIENMGDTRGIIKGDNEPAMKALAPRIKEMRTHPTVVEESPDTNHRPTGSQSDACRPSGSWVHLGKHTRRTPSSHMANTTCRMLA